MQVDIFGMDHNGNGLGRINEKIVFVPKSIPGDKCLIKLVKDHKTYSIGRIEKVVEPGSNRKEVECPYYYICGGCNISNLSYSEQLKFKKDKVKNIFKKYLGLEIDPIIIGSDKEYQYRNKITFQGDKVNLGLISLDNKVIDINGCLLVSERVNELYNMIKLLDISKVLKVIIKECDNGLILSVYGELEIDSLKDKCLAIYINDKCVYKDTDGYILIGSKKYVVSDRSFFQINTGNIHKLYDTVKRLGNFQKSDLVVDLYCGVGSIGIYIADDVASVLGIEIVSSAIDDAYRNAKMNGISNIQFICGDVSKLIDDNLVCDKLIVDPPRVGLDKHTVSVINNSLIKTVIYVSCDAMTLARDISNLTNYLVDEIVLVDMFPQTHHVESVSVLRRKKLEK